MIKVESLTKRFLSPVPVTAVDGVSFEVGAGEVLGLLGPNGAGKTTTLRMLATLIRPDGGRASLAGHELQVDPGAVRRSIGYLSASTGLYPRLTARELLHYFARIQGVPDPTARTEATIARFDLQGFADRRCEHLSTGMRQKVSIARATIHDPPILILDEPTAGLDVLVAQTLLTFVEEARAQGRTVVYSTHVMSEAERLCDRIAVVHQGRILEIGTLEALRDLTGERYLEAIFIALVNR
jgi:sodium transport system ATP-binding protein